MGFLYDYHVIQADETPVLVNKDGRSAGSKSYSLSCKKQQLFISMVHEIYRYGFNEKKEPISKNSALKIFLSHAKDGKNGLHIAKQLKRLIDDSTLTRFFDSNDIAPGYRFDDEIINNIKESSVIIINSDIYSSRYWCQREIQTAKELERPIIEVDLIDEAMDRKFPFAGNVPVIRVNAIEGKVEEEEEDMKCQIFISYRADESLQFARQLYSYLTNLKYSVFFDEKSTRSGFFNEAIYNAIDECEDFILLMTPGTFVKRKEDWVYQELARALKKEKNIIPIALYGVERFPENLDSDIKDVKYCHIIKLDKYDQFWGTIYEAISVRSHRFKRRQLLEEGSPLLKWMNRIFEKTSAFLIVKCIFDLIIHYMFNLSWNVPFIIRRIFYALYELSVFKILCINISGILILKVFIVVYKRADVVYLQKAQSYKNIDVKDFESLPVYIRMKLAALNIKRYKKNMKKDFGGDEHLIIGWRNYAEMDGLVLGSDNNSETTYFCMLYKKWPRINVCCIGKRTFRKKCIYNLNRQGFDYIGCNENIMHFESPKGIEINILYGKWWPEAIEIKNKEIPGRLRDWFFYQNFIYTDENGKRHECEFWGTEEYNQDMYIIESINLRENGQLVKRAIIIKKEKEDYIMAELSEAEIVFKIFAEKHK